MRKILPLILFIAPILAKAQVANPEGTYTSTRISNAGYTVSSDDPGSASPVSNAVDGDTTTFWENTYPATSNPLPHYITVNMQSPTTIGGIFIVSRPSWVGTRSPNLVAIYTSTDSITWTLQDSGHLGQTVAVNIPFQASVTCQYYKIIVYTVGNNNGTGTDPNDIINLAETGGINVTRHIPDPNAYSRTGWSVLSYSSQSDAAIQAIDNDSTTLWQSAWSGTPAHFPHYIVVDMTAPIPVNQVAYRQRKGNLNGQADSVTIAFSDDNSTWGAEIPLRFTYHGTDGKRNLINLPGGTQTHRYFRLTLLNNYAHILYSSKLDSLLSVNPGTYYATGIGEIGWDYDQLLTTPVTLESFDGSITNGVATLKWTSGVEDNFKEYDVQSSTDGKTFATIGTINSKGSSNDYSFTTTQINSDVYYRLKLVDNDGSFKYSGIIKLSKTISEKLKIYPVPATDYINIKVDKISDAKIYNTSGQVVKIITLQAGVNKIDIIKLPIGTYYLLIDKKSVPFIKK